MRVAADQDWAFNGNIEAQVRFGVDSTTGPSRDSRDGDLRPRQAAPPALAMEIIGDCKGRFVTGSSVSCRTVRRSRRPGPAANEKGIISVRFARAPQLEYTRRTGTHRLESAGGVLEKGAVRVALPPAPIDAPRGNDPDSVEEPIPVAVVCEEIDVPVPAGARRAGP